jgi:hypothetical protein
MGQFQLYFQLGIQHILDIKGFDHILFVVALCAIYVTRDWKKILILVTAFTIGHSITLALATLKLVKVNSDWIEFLIPVTIAVTAVSNIFSPKPSSGRGIQINYVFALFFGLIHGLGFSNYFKSILPGSSSDKLLPLLEFALGIEAAQIIVVIIVLIISYFVQTVFRFSKRDWTLVASAFVCGVVVPMIIESEIWG